MSSRTYITRSLDKEAVKRARAAAPEVHGQHLERQAERRRRHGLKRAQKAADAAGMPEVVGVIEEAESEGRIDLSKAYGRHVT